MKCSCITVDWRVLQPYQQSSNTSHYQITSAEQHFARGVNLVVSLVLFSFAWYAEASGKQHILIPRRVWEECVCSASLLAQPRSACLCMSTNTHVHSYTTCTHNTCAHTLFPFLCTFVNDLAHDVLILSSNCLKGEPSVFHTFAQSEY